MEEIEYYNKAKEYLLSFDAVTNEMLDAHFDEWEKRKPNTITELFNAFLMHAQNRQGMPNSIGDINKLSPVLFEFDHIRVNEHYEDWEALFDAITSSNYTVFRVR